MNSVFNKRGSMLLMVMVMLIVAALLAMKLMPDEQTLNKREDETFYDSDLSQLREAVDLARLAAQDENNDKMFYREDPSAPNGEYFGWQGFLASDTPEKIKEKIDFLVSNGFLRKSNIRDNSVPEHLWGEDKTYWRVSTNYASNTSFEIDVVGDTGTVSYNWMDSKDGSCSVAENIHLNSMAIDEYPYQNKLGDSTRGENAIKMICIEKTPTVTP